MILLVILFVFALIFVALIGLAISGALIFKGAYTTTAATSTEKVNSTKIDWSNRKWVTPDTQPVPACEQKFAQLEDEHGKANASERLIASLTLDTLRECKTANSWWGAALRHPNALGAADLGGLGPDNWLQAVCQANEAANPVVCTDWQTKHGF